jgi:hypothetical protein
MKVTIIPKSEFERLGACRAYLDSPKWRKDSETLLIDDEAMEIMLSTREGVTHLNWLVTHKLVPMTLDEFTETLKTHGTPEVSYVQDRS